METGLEVSSFSALGSCRVSLGRVPLLRQWVWPKAKVLAGSSLWGLTGVTGPPSLFALHSFPELEHPRLSKVLRTAAFVYPFLYDNIPLFCRVSRGVPGVLPPQGSQGASRGGPSLFLTHLSTASLLLLE